MDQAHVLLKQYYGYDSFLPGQEQAVNALLAGRDLLAVMPTGAGKSVCFQLPALALPGVTLVISPLISLMSDQVAALRQAGIPAAYLNSSLTARQYMLALDYARHGRYRLIYVAPERLRTAAFLDFVRQTEIALVAVDEAHCVSQWGPEFRPSYLGIPDFMAQLRRRPPLGAFTATATPRLREDMTRQLALMNPVQVATGFDRPELHFSVVQTEQKDAALRKIVLEHAGEAGIVYCATRRLVEQVCGMLQACGVPATRYHAGLEPEERRENQEAFLYDRKTVMVATSAFGMGIDKSNVRYVVHYNMPMDLESYYQEAGRAGRDRGAAVCVLLFSSNDVTIARYLLEHSEPQEPVDEAQRKAVQEASRARLRQMIRYCSTTGCLRQFLLRYFGEQAPERCGNCGNCRPARPAPAPRGRGADGALYEQLRMLRLQIAREEDIPPFLVFSDRTLQEMARQRPTNERELARLAGVNRQQREHYGRRFLARIRAFEGK